MQRRGRGFLVVPVLKSRLQTNPALTGQFVSPSHRHPNKSEQTITQFANQQVLMALKDSATADREVRRREGSICYPEGVRGEAPVEQESTQMGWCQTARNTTTFPKIAKNSMKKTCKAWGDHTDILTSGLTLASTPCHPVPLVGVPSAPPPHTEGGALMLCC